MQALYFPFTYMSAQTAQTLITAGLDEPVVYLPDCRQPATHCDIHYRTPITAGDTQLQALLKQYRHWLSVHGGRAGEAAAFFKSAQTAPPFFEDSHTFKITSEIRQHLRKDSTAGPSLPAPTETDDLTARLFLLIAQEFDNQQVDLEFALNGVSRDRRHLMESLGALAGDDRFPTHAPDDPGQLMTAQRLSAWGQLLLADPDPPRLLVTTSPAVIAFARDMAADEHLQPLQASRSGSRLTDMPAMLDWLDAVYSLPIVSHADGLKHFYLASNAFVYKLFNNNYSNLKENINPSSTSASWIIGDFSIPANLPEKIISKA